MRNGVLFDPLTGAEILLYAFTGGSDGYGPAAGLIEYGGKLYGTTAFGGSSNCEPYGCGTVFSIDLGTGAQTVVHAFTGGSDGAASDAGLTLFGSKLYGTTEDGGSVGLCSCGTVFSVDPLSGTEKVVHAFTGGDGAYPFPALINVNGLLYGTTSAGGPSCDCGTVFSVDPKTGTMVVVHAFGGGNDGIAPEAGLINVGGTLYGTTIEGGGFSHRFCSRGCGVVFSVQPASGVETVVYAFKGGRDVQTPRGDLISVDGLLYGTSEFGARRGGGNGSGAVFSVDPVTGVETVVHAFTTSAEGLYPNGSLLKMGRWLYGTTVDGGTAKCACGVLYAVRP